MAQPLPTLLDNNVTGSPMLLVFMDADPFDRLGHDHFDYDHFDYEATCSTQEKLKTEKWRIVEGIVASLARFMAPAGAVVTTNARVPYREAPALTRKVDIHISSPAEPMSVGIEVKARGRRLTVKEVEGVGAMLDKLSLDRRILVSTSGFCKGTDFDAWLAGLELVELRKSPRRDSLLQIGCPPHTRLLKLLFDRPMGELHAYQLHDCTAISITSAGFCHITQFTIIIKPGEPGESLDLRFDVATIKTSSKKT